MNTVRRPLDRDVNSRPPVQGQSSPEQVKDTYIGSTSSCICRLILQTNRVYNVQLPRIIRNSLKPNDTYHFFFIETQNFKMDDGWLTTRNKSKVDTFFTCSAPIEYR